MSEPLPFGHAVTYNSPVGRLPGFVSHYKIESGEVLYMVILDKAYQGNCFHWIAEKMLSW